MRKLVVACMLCLLGCEDQGWQMPLDVPTKQGRIVPMAQTAPASPLPGPRVQSAPAAPTASLYWQVVVLHKPEELPESGRVVYIAVERLTAEQAGELVAGLWPSAGQAGTPRRFTLLYPTPAEQRGAVEAVRRLEELAKDEAWLSAAGEALAIRQADPAVLAQWAGRAEQWPGEWARWAGRMLAGHLAGLVGDDWKAAGEGFRSAMNMSPNGSPEQLLARLQLADALARGGARSAARELAAGIVAAPGPLRGTEAAARAGRLMDQLDR